jgi:probable O-glycosylation ligase (exosortase A-associated)
MAGKSTFVDYEPVTRPGGAKRTGADGVDKGVPQSPSLSDGERGFGRSAEGDEGGAISSNRWPEKCVELLENLPKPIDQQEHWVLKQGHAVSYIGVFLFTFLVYFRPYEFFPSLSWLANSAFWVAIFTLAVFVPTQLGLENRITIRPREVNLVLLLTAAGLISIPLALEPLRAWNSFVDYLKVVLIFIVMVNVVRTEKRLKGIWLLVLMVTLILSLGAINDYESGRLALQGTRIKGMIGGLFENPNDLALHLVTMIPIGIALVLSSRSPLGKLFYLACAIVTTAAIVVTFSRGGFLGLVCTVGVLLWRLARRSRVLIGSIGAVTIVLFIAFAPGGYGGRLSTTSDDSAMARFDDLKRSVFIAAHHPLFGVGMDNYVLYSNSNHATHNAYTQVAAELGFPAMLIYILFLITPLKELRRVASETSSSGSTARFHYQAIGLEASLIGYMVASFFASVAFLWYAYYLIAYAICLSRIYRNEQISTGLQVK